MHVSSQSNTRVTPAVVTQASKGLRADVFCAGWTHKGLAGAIEHCLRKGAASCKCVSTALGQVSGAAFMEASTNMCDFIMVPEHPCHDATYIMTMNALACSGMAWLKTQP